MSIKRNLFTGSVVAVLAAGVFFKISQATQRKSKAGRAAAQGRIFWTPKEWLRQLSSKSST